MKIISVNSSQTKREFLKFPAVLYKNDKNYIRPLDKDIEEIFEPQKNKNFKNGECERFLFKNEKNETVAKVAVFINKKYKMEQPTGGIGFFDCINDQKTANFVFDFCKKWLQERGIEAMDGPINFGERDRFWGLLTKGFHEPLFGMNYNFPYYKDLFENYGFQVYYEQLCFSRSIHQPVSDSFIEMHEKHSKNKDITAISLKKNQLEKFAKDFTEIYNKAWYKHGEGKEMDQKKAMRIFKNMKPILNEHICWFVYHQEKPIAMWLNIPDLNQWFKFLNGKFGILEKLKFLWLKKFKKNPKMIGIIFGVVPEWQRKGIDGFMICEGTHHLRKFTKFKETELQWIGDFNPKMIRIAENLDTFVSRKLATYRYLFDREKTFERHKILL